jgi:hypothetical protein
MRMRFTMRTMMAGLALVVFVLWGVELRRRSNAYAVTAWRHAYDMEADEGAYCSLYAPSGAHCLLGDPDAKYNHTLTPDAEFAACLHWQMAAKGGSLLVRRDDEDTRERYHHRMYHKWKRAAARPWQSVEPDPNDVN